MKTKFKFLFQKHHAKHLSFMQLVFLSVLPCFLLLGCKKNIETTSGNDDTSKISHVVPIEEAISQVYEILNELDADMPSPRKVKDIRVMYRQKDFNIIAGGIQRVQSQAGLDTLFYILDFENDRGSAVVSADNRTETKVVAITDEKNFLAVEDAVIWEPADNANDPDFANFHLYNAEEEEYYIQSINPTNLLTERIHNFLMNQISDYSVHEGGNGGSGSSTTTVSDWITVEKINPKLTTLWHQDPPFNSLCPLKSGIRTPAGCVAIAVAQIMAYHQYPANPVQLSGWSWTDIKQICKIPYGTTSASNLAQSHVASFIRDIGDRCNMHYGSSGSWALPKNAAKCMREYGYSNAQRDYLGNDFEDKPAELQAAVNMLRNDCPVFLAGVYNLSSAHAWVIDGYWQRRKDKITTYSNGTTSTSTYQTQKLLHCNWGWHGSCNGYYVSGIFNTQNGATATEPAGYGDNNSTFTDNYNWLFYMINYTKPNH